MKVLITGGAGFIGATVATACIEAGITPVILDDFSTGRREFVEGRASYEGDIADATVLGRIFADHPDLTVAIHCAAKIVVPDSVADPIAYYDNNVAKTFALVGHLLSLGCTRLLFSSSASIYAPGADLTVDESSALAPGSPYATSKMVVELFLADVAIATGMRVLSLRYFNPIGADPQLRTGLQLKTPSHAVGKLLEAYASGTPFMVTGTEYATRDGSAIRDYIHVWDLALAHVAALQAMDRIVEPGTALPINIGTGTGTTVRELVERVPVDRGRVRGDRRAPAPGRRHRFLHPQRARRGACSAGRRSARSRTACGTRWPGCNAARTSSVSKGFRRISRHLSRASSTETLGSSSDEHRPVPDRPGREDLRSGTPRPGRLSRVAPAGEVRLRQPRTAPARPRSTCATAQRPRPTCARSSRRSSSSSPVAWAGSSPTTATPPTSCRDNLRIQVNVMDAAHDLGVQRLLFLGSSCIYPKFAEQPIREESLMTGALEPTNDAYAIAKIAGIIQVQAHRRQHGVQWISAMPTNLYGPGDNFDPAVSHVLPALMRRFHEAAVRGDDEVVLWGTGSPRREFMHVDDLASALVFLLENYDDAQTINVGVGTDVTIREVAETMADVVGFTGRIVQDTSKPDGTPRKLLDISRLTAMGWAPEVELREGLADTYRWFLANQATARL